MKRLLLFVFVLLVQLAHSQYCGTSGPSVCTTSGLTAPGITNYQTFPCVKQGEAYSEVLQVFFPDTASQLGFTVPVTSVTIDSITNLPCGLCWQCDNATFTYAGGSPACIKISGTTTDITGAYQLKMYGTANTAFGPFSGSLENLGYQFFLNVVPSGGTCTSINILDLKLACTATPAVPQCNFNIELDAVNYGATCDYDSVKFTLLSPLGSQYKHYWNVVDYSVMPPVFYTDSTNLSFTVNTTSNSLMHLTIMDSSGCYKTYSPTYSNEIGAVHIPSICYTTFDTALANGGPLQIVFQKDDWYNTATSYRLWRQDAANLNKHLIGSIPSTNYGIISDNNPFIINPDSAYSSDIRNLYTLGVGTACGNVDFGGAEFNPAKLVVRSSFLGQGTGFPLVMWEHSSPLVYDGLYIYSRSENTGWRLRFSTIDMTDTSWIDLHPDAEEMEYMLGLKLNVTCDPSRAAPEMIFTNFGSTAVDSANVDTAEIINPVGLSNVVRQNKFVFYPNPTESVLYLQLANTTAVSNMQAVVYNTMGQIVVSEAVSAPTINKLDVGALTPGIYMIAIQGNGYSSTMQKFVKK